VNIEEEKILTVNRRFNRVV